ncbi:uncharacterized protein [Pseudorasbora parva]|uniref:uncharacterized protein n=1 Tax=Pseudorasbora parva TaxID=51549 RepID=UPI00351F7B7E
MCSYWVFLHIFAALLVCNYGMFSTPSPSSAERTTIEISNTSDSNTTVTTAQSAPFKNFTKPNSNYYYSSEPSTNASYEDTFEEEILVPVSGTKSTKGTPSTAHPMTTNANQNTSEGKNDSGSYTGGIIMLVIIIILIVLLLGILYFLRKKGRSYSFDLTRVDGPANDYDTPLQSDQQGISYEQTNKDLSVCLDYAEEEKSEQKTSPIANGCAGEKTEQAADNKNDDQNLPEENSFSSNSSLTPPMKKVEFNLDLDLIGGSDYPVLNDLTTDDAPQNENNNNVSNAGRGSAEEIFTEISLDEPQQHA